jgi:hypothetical protein
VGRAVARGEVAPVTEPRRIAVVRDYDQLVAALRAHALAIGATRRQIDEVAGLPSRYTATLLAPGAVKALGRTSMGPILGALGLMLVVVEDADAMAKHAKRLGTGKRSYQLNGAKNASIVLRFSRRKLRKMALASAAARMLKIPARKRQSIARKAGKARMEKITPEQRSEFARVGAKARWKGHHASSLPMSTTRKKPYKTSIVRDLS